MKRGHPAEAKNCRQEAQPEGRDRLDSGERMGLPHAHGAEECGASYLDLNTPARTPFPASRFWTKPAFDLDTPSSLSVRARALCPGFTTFVYLKLPLPEMGEPWRGQDDGRGQRVLLLLCASLL